MALLEYVPDAVVVTDRFEAIVFANAQAEKMFGYSRFELLGKNLETLIPERFRRGNRNRGQATFLDKKDKPKVSKILSIRRLHS